MPLLSHKNFVLKSSCSLQTNGCFLSKMNVFSKGKKALGQTDMIKTFFVKVMCGWSTQVLGFGKERFLVKVSRAFRAMKRKQKHGKKECFSGTFGERVRHSGSPSSLLIYQGTSSGKCQIFFNSKEGFFWEASGSDLYATIASHFRKDSVAF